MVHSLSVSTFCDVLLLVMGYLHLLKVLRSTSLTTCPMVGEEELCAPFLRINCGRVSGHRDTAPSEVASSFDQANNTHLTPFVC